MNRLDIFALVLLIIFGSTFLNAKSAEDDETARDRCENKRIAVSSKGDLENKEKGKPMPYAPDEQKRLETLYKNMYPHMGEAWATHAAEEKVKRGIAAGKKGQPNGICDGHTSCGSLYYVDTTGESREVCKNRCNKIECDNNIVKLQTMLRNRDDEDLKHRNLNANLFPNFPENTTPFDQNRELQKALWENLSPPAKARGNDAGYEFGGIPYPTSHIESPYTRDELNNGTLRSTPEGSSPGDIVKGIAEDRRIFNFDDLMKDPDELVPQRGGSTPDASHQIKLSPYGPYNERVPTSKLELPEKVQPVSYSGFERGAAGPAVGRELPIVRAWHTFETWFNSWSPIDI